MLNKLYGIIYERYMKDINGWQRSAMYKQTVVIRVKFINENDVIS